MATHSSILAWKIPWTEEPGGVQSMGLQRVRHDWSDSKHRTHTQWELNHKESWALKNWCFWTAVLEKTLESPLDCKEIQPVHSKKNQSWIFTGRTDAEAETPIFWPPGVKSPLIGKDPGAGQEEKEDDRGWDGWMASPTQWTWVWANSGRQWRTGRPGVLQFMGSQRVGHNWVTEHQQLPLLFQCPCWNTDFANFL